MKIAVLLLSLILIAAGVATFLAGRRLRLNRSAAGREPGLNVLPAVGVGLLAVGLLTLVRAF